MSGSGFYYYSRDLGRILWVNAAIYKDAWGENREVLVRMGDYKRWGCVYRILKESKVLARMLALNDAGPVLDLGEVAGGGVNTCVSRDIVDYLCGFNSDWWEKTPSLGALDLADVLGLERLLTWVVREDRTEHWLDGKQMLINNMEIGGMCGKVKELRIVRCDEWLRPYSMEEFLDYYSRELGRILWRNAAIYKDARGVNREVLVRMGDYKSWGFVSRIVKESKVLATMLVLNDAVAVLDLGAVAGGGVNIYVSRRIVDYVCGYDSDWWEKSPTLGALDLADLLGLERLLVWVVRDCVREHWLKGKPKPIKKDKT